MGVCMGVVWGWGVFPWGGFVVVVGWFPEDEICPWLEFPPETPESFSASVPAPKRPSSRQTFILRATASHEYYRSLGQKITISVLSGQRPTCRPPPGMHEGTRQSCGGVGHTATAMLETGNTSQDPRYLSGGECCNRGGEAVHIISP